MLITDSKAFGKALHDRRKKLGYTQAFVSEVTGLSVSFISDAENGKTTLEFEKALRLANMLGLNLDITER